MRLIFDVFISIMDAVSDLICEVYQYIKKRNETK